MISENPLNLSITDQIKQNQVQISDMNTKIDNLNNQSTTLGWANFGLNVVGTIANIWMSMKQLDFAEEQLDFSKEQFNKNFALSLDAYARTVDQKYRSQKWMETGDRAYLDPDQMQGQGTEGIPYLEEYLGQDSAFVSTYDSSSSTDQEKTQVLTAIDDMKKSILENGDIPEQYKEIGISNYNPNIDYKKSATDLITAPAKQVDPSMIIDNTVNASIGVEEQKDIDTIKSETTQTNDTTIPTQNQDVADNTNTPVSAFAQDSTNRTYKYEPEYKKYSQFNQQDTNQTSSNNPFLDNFDKTIGRGNNVSAFATNSTSTATAQPNINPSGSMLSSVNTPNNPNIQTEPSTDSSSTYSAFATKEKRLANKEDIDKDKNKKDNKKSAFAQ